MHGPINSNKGLNRPSLPIQHTQRPSERTSYGTTWVSHQEKRKLSGRSGPPTTRLSVQFTPIPRPSHPECGYPDWPVTLRRQRIVVRAILQDLAHEFLHVILSQDRSIRGLLECWLLQVTGRPHGEEQMLCLTPTSFGCDSGGGSRAYFDVLSIPRVIRPVSRTRDMLTFPVSRSR